MISELGKKKEEEEKNKEKVNDNTQDDKKIKLPIHYYVKCCKKIEANSEAKFKEAKSKIKDQGKDKNMVLKMFEEEKEKIFSDELTENFLYFFTSIFLHYQEYCTKYQFEYVGSNEQSMSLFRKSSASYMSGVHPQIFPMESWKISMPTTSSTMPGSAMPTFMTKWLISQGDE